MPLKYTLKDRTSGTFLVVQWLRLLVPNAGVSSSIPGQRTRANMPQLRVLMMQLRPGTVK